MENSAVDPMEISRFGQVAGEPSVAEQVSALLTLGGGSDRFLSELLKVQCRVAAADAGVLIRLGQENRFEILAAHPLPKNGCAADGWIGRVAAYARDAVIRGDAEKAPKSGKGSARRVIVFPIRKQNQVRAVAAFVIRAQGAEDLAARRDRLEITPFLIDFYELQATLSHRHATLDGIRAVLDVLSAVSRCNRFMSAAMTLCNEIAARWNCCRVSLGFQYGRYVRVRAMSHTDSFNSKMKLVQAIEAAMEEALDQDLEVIHPAAAAGPTVSRDAEQLSRDQGPEAVLSMPIRQEDGIPAVLTLERAPEQPFAIEEVEAIRLLLELCSLRMVELHERDRWFGARMAAFLKAGLARLVGPTHTWVKLWVLLACCAGIFSIFAEGTYRVESPFVFESTVRQLVVSPIDTFIKSVSVAPGDCVEAQRTVLGELETSELRLKLAALKAEQIGYQKEMAASIRDRRDAESQIALAKSDKVAAEIRLLEQQIDQATLVAPITGRIVSEDLKQRLGAPVEKGGILFEIAGIESLRAELYVPEGLVFDIREGQEGELAAVGHPDQRIGFFVERIRPMADVVNHRNVFRVQASLAEQKPWMRPGMEGIAKITIREKRLAWIASRRIVDWLRMTFWL